MKSQNASSISAERRHGPWSNLWPLKLAKKPWDWVNLLTIEFTREGDVEITVSGATEGLVKGDYVRIGDLHAVSVTVSESG